jgi:hypothetical protein
MPRIDKDQIVGPDGQIISEVTVIRPVPRVPEARFQQIKRDLRNPNVPLTLPQMRAMLVEITQYLSNELDDENE